MRFDDRLATVLGQPAVDAHGRAVQWRQLVELVARSGSEGSVLRDHALERIAALMDEVPPSVLDATARAVAGRGVPVELIALFAARGMAASAALVTAAELDPADWATVRAVAAPDVLPFIASLHPEAGSPPPPETPKKVAAPAQPSPDLPPPAGLFRWECGPTGEIDWVEGGPRAALVGRSLTEPFADRFAARLPFSDKALVLAEEGTLAGEWRWSGSPAFFPDTGRFAGYRGIARREGAELSASAALPTMPEDDDLRELMHELRTPLNAIIGFGEIIEGQYLGPAHRAYRARAAEIVAQARRLADAVDNLDLSAKLRSGRYQGEATAALEDVRDVLVDLREEAALKGIALVVEDRASGARVALPPPLAERLARQFAAALADAANAGETLRITLDRAGPHVSIAIDRPQALQGCEEEQLLGAKGVAGTRFALRLVKGLAAMTGGRLDLTADRLVLLLPLAKA